LLPRLFVGDNLSGIGETEPVRGAAGPALDPAIMAALRSRLPLVAERTVAAVTAEVPGYGGALTGQMGTTIEQAVQTALGGFLRLAEQAKESDPSTPLQPAIEGAYALGRGEARSGRTMDALLAAYRVGARVSWREWAAIAVERGLSAPTLAQFAELVFAYIDQLSAASVAGHTDELETTGRVRQRYLEKLAEDLLSEATTEALLASAERAGWTPPDCLTAVLLPAARLHGALALLDPRTLAVSSDGTGAGEGAVAVLLIPAAKGLDRKHLLRTLEGRLAVVGPARPWTRVASSYRRAVRGFALLGAGTLTDTLPDTPFDTDEHLAELVLTADPDALADLRARVLAPLSSLRPTTAERLAETLRSWLLHHGRREDIADDLVVHPQTVRYRMTQLRELYGDRLNDPETVLELTLALARQPSS